MAQTKEIKKSDSNKKKNTTGSSSGKGKNNSTYKKKTQTRSNKGKTGKRVTKQERMLMEQKRQQMGQLGKDVVALIGFAFVLILILSEFGLAGSVGEGIKGIMFGLMGIVAYVFPFVVAFSIVFLLANQDLIGVARVKVIATFIALVLASGMYVRVVENPAITDEYGLIYNKCASEYIGGGIIGAFFCKILEPLGLFGTILVLFILFLICVLIITEKSFIRGVKKVGRGSSRVVRTARDDYNAYRKHRRELDEEYEDDDYEDYYNKKNKNNKSRLNKKVSGVTTDTTLVPDESSLNGEYADVGAHNRFSGDSMIELTSEGLSKSDSTAALRKHEFEKELSASEIVKKTLEKWNKETNIDDIHVDITRNDEFTPDIYSENDIPADGKNSNVQDAKDNSDVKISRDYVVEDHIDNTDIIDDKSEIHKKDDSFDIGVNRPKASRDRSKDSSTSNEVKQQSKQQIKTSIQQENELDEVEDVQDIKPDLHSDNTGDYKFPPLSLLSNNRGASLGNQRQENEEKAEILRQTLQTFGVKVSIGEISCGPSVTRFELHPEQGVKVSKIVSLSDDIKLNLAAADIRIEAPIPGKAAIGIEVPNKEPGSVFLRELLESSEFVTNKSNIAFAAGKDIAGKVIIADIAKMPHMLIAGATGSGKSVCINTIIMSILYKAHPDDVKLIMVDPKVVELSCYNGIPHLLLPVVTEPKKAAAALNWAVNEMTERYKKLAAMEVREIKGYNAKVEEENKRIEAENALIEDESQKKKLVEKLPQIVIIIDELADLMMVASGEVEDSICRLAQLARAAGIHLIIATQRPTVNVITGLIKANVPSKIAFAVASGIDSRTILDMNGAEKLLGKGDMLFAPANLPKPIRVQGAFVSDGEVNAVVDFLKQNQSQEVTYNESITEAVANPISMAGADSAEERDPLFVEAGRFVIEKEKGSIGMLQRFFKIGFNRAGRIIDQLADAGVVGPEIGTKPRKILMTMQEFDAFVEGRNE